MHCFLQRTLVSAVAVATANVAATNVAAANAAAAVTTVVAANVAAPPTSAELQRRKRELLARKLCEERGLEYPPPSKRDIPVLLKGALPEAELKALRDAHFNWQTFDEGEDGEKQMDELRDLFLKQTVSSLAKLAFCARTDVRLALLGDATLIEHVFGDEAWMASTRKTYLGRIYLAQRALSQESVPGGLSDSDKCAMRRACAALEPLRSASNAAAHRLALQQREQIAGVCLTRPQLQCYAASPVRASAHEQLARWAAGNDQAADVCEDGAANRWWQSVWCTALSSLSMRLRTVEALLVTDLLLESGQRRQAVHKLTADDLAQRADQTVPGVTLLTLAVSRRLWST